MAAPAGDSPALNRYDAAWFLPSASPTTAVLPIALPLVFAVGCSTRMGQGKETVVDPKYLAKEAISIASSTRRGAKRSMACSASPRSSTGGIRVN